jgi:non-ribosomal peptide synthetase component F
MRPVRQLYSRIPYSQLRWNPGKTLGFRARGWEAWRRGLLTESHSRGPASASHLLAPLSLSANSIPLQPPLLTQTIPQHFASVVSAHGDRTAVISRAQRERLTYRELDERSNILARGLWERGVRKGDRVAVSLGNNWEFAVTTYALFKLGAILVRLSLQFDQQEKEQY